jgi:hypothetical protein
MSGRHASNVVTLVVSANQPPAPEKKPYTIDLFSAGPTKGMIMFEACVPLETYVAFRGLLESLFPS